jgi:lipopolysaccharide biosynthesis glycosyltransferase
MARYCVTLVCNEGYLDKAGFVAEQLLAQSNRNFDVLICTDTIPDQKPSFLPEGVSLRQIVLDDTLTNLPQNERLKHYTYWRLPAIEMLSTEYERILYLDTDVFVAEDGLSALFDVDMQGATLAATLDVHQRHRPDRAVREFTAMGYETAPYFNAGVLLVDGRRWHETLAFENIMRIAQTSPEVLFCHDQSLLNIQFYNDWLELSPVWNWQNSDRVNLVVEFISPYLIHFIGPTKVWNTPDGSIPIKYHNAFAVYTGQRIGEHQGTKSVFNLLVKNIWYWRKTSKYLSSFTNPSDTKRHMPLRSEKK